MMSFIKKIDPVKNEFRRGSVQFKEESIDILRDGSPNTNPLERFRKLVSQNKKRRENPST